MFVDTCTRPAPFQVVVVIVVDMDSSEVVLCTSMIPKNEFHAIFPYGHVGADFKAGIMSIFFSFSDWLLTTLLIQP